MPVNQKSWGAKSSLLVTHFFGRAFSGRREINLSITGRSKSSLSDFRFLITLEIMYLLIVFLPLLGSSVAGFFGRFLGAEGSAILITTCVAFCALVGFSFGLSSFRLKGTLKKIIPLFFLFSAGFVGSLIRIEVIHLVGDQAFPLLVPLVWYAVGEGALPSTGPNGAESSSTWEENSFELQVLEESYSPPAEESQGEPSVNQPFVFGAEREAWAQEDPQISAEVETIMNACENLQAAMVRKAHLLLHERGVTLADPEDIKRALQLALHDDWEHDIDNRIRHFTMLKRDFGTTRCERWNPFIDELRSLGNFHVNARHYVD